MNGLFKWDHQEELELEPINPSQFARLHFHADETIFQVDKSAWRTLWQEPHFFSILYFHVVRATAGWVHLRENIQQWTVMMKTGVADCLDHITGLLVNLPFHLGWQPVNSGLPVIVELFICWLCWHLGCPCSFCFFSGIQVYFPNVVLFFCVFFFPFSFFLLGKVLVSLTYFALPKRRNSIKYFWKNLCALWITSDEMVVNLKQINCVFWPHWKQLAPEHVMGWNDG